MKIQIEAEILPTMGGAVTFYTKLCPHGMSGILTGSSVCTVGSSSCKMCAYYGGEQKDETDQDCVICNRD